jgi:hypothetical protein
VVLVASKRLHHSGKVIEYPDIPREELESHEPLHCLFLGDSALSARFSFFLSTLLLTLYDTAPEPLRENASRIGVEPVKLNLGNPVHVVLMSYYRRAVLTLCRLCPLRGECPWWTALRSLKIYSER